MGLFGTLLVFGTASMFLVMLSVSKYYSVPKWKLLCTAPMLTVTGVLGASLLFAIENPSAVGGVSFYGAVFLPPVVMSLFSLLIRVPATVVLDLCAPAECIMLALLKIRCMVEGCCIGRVFMVMNSGKEIRFPSQIIEMFTVLVIMLMLLKLMKEPDHRGKIYAYYLVLYGGTRFVLNWFRDTNTFLLGLPAGNFWSLAAIAAGLIWIFLIQKSWRKGEQSDDI